MKLLLGRGAQINARPAVRGGWIVLHATAGSGHLTMVEMPIEKGAMVNAEPSIEDSRTAIQAAAEMDISR